jgi:AcrR family transcriptional regulator
MPPTANRRPGRPPAAKADETRKRILRAAREVFSERGYVGATFQAIAVRADLTRPAINHYFSSKRVLYREVVAQTNELVVRSAIERARDQDTTMGRLSQFIAVAMQAEIDHPSTSAFLVTAVMESQRHPELSRTGNDPVRISREFLTWAVSDAIERGELPADTDVPSLTETLLVVLCGVGFYAGFIGSYQEMTPITESLEKLLAGRLWRSVSHATQEVHETQQTQEAPEA